MRSIWKGSLGFGLVNIPIKLYSAVQNSALDLDMLDGRDHAKIRFQRVNEQTHKEVPFDKIVKGYLLKDDYVILEDEDFEAASPKKTKMIEIENFVDITQIAPIFYETSYYAEPEAAGKKAYALLRAALLKSRKAGLARFVLRSTENLCIIHPMDKALVITKIRFAEEIRDTEELLLPADGDISRKELDLGLNLINQYSDKFDISAFKDSYHNELLKIIKAKAKGKKPVIRKLKPEKKSSDDLYDQLMASLKPRKGA